MCPKLQEYFIFCTSFWTKVIVHRKKHLYILSNHHSNVTVYEKLSLLLSLSIEEYFLIYMTAWSICSVLTGINKIPTSKTPLDIPLFWHAFCVLFCCYFCKSIVYLLMNTTAKDHHFGIELLQILIVTFLVSYILRIFMRQKRV